MKYTASSSSRRKALKVSVSTTLQKPVKVSISTALRQPSSDSEEDAGDIREEIKRRGRPKRPAKPPIVVLPPVKRPSRKPRALSEQGPSASKEPNLSGQEKRHVNFGNVEVFRFAFAQGRDTVPTHGGVSLGMENIHHARHLFQQGEYAKYCKAEKRTKMCRWQAAQRVVKNARTSGRRKRKLAPKRQRSKKRKYVADKRVEQSTSSSEADSLSASEEEEESSMFDQFHLLEPTRRVLLANSGVTIEENVANESLHVVETRARCGCRCDGQKCVPELCECALDGIQCQVDVLDESNPFNSYPCTCSAQSCGNPKGRIELDPLRIRNHFMQTLMRLKAAKKKGLDESGQVHSPQHIVFADAEDNHSEDEKKEKPNKPRIRSPHRRRGDAVSVSATPPKAATPNKKGGGSPRATGKKQGRPRANCKKEVE